ncbi:MAG TPA: sugar phosphate isomerase/epimerase family protein [Candidatus Aquilonibacter sp.]|nr:sugar phosphate isomerase/epimerase family protein [Candidatus Aquilonibacter sp.]
MTQTEFNSTERIRSHAAGFAAGKAADADIKVGLYSITYLGVWYRGGALALEDVVLRAKKYGYSGIEIDGKRPHGNPLDMPKSRCEQLRRFANEQGVEIYAVAANNDFSSPIPEHRESQILYVRELLEMTQNLGAKLMRVFMAWPGVTLFAEGGGSYDVAKSTWRQTHEMFSEEQIWDWCRAGLAETARYASECGITLALQNHPPVVKSYKDCLRMIEEIGATNLKMCFDGRLEKRADDAEVERATAEVGARQVLSHYGGEYDEGPEGITITPGEKCMAEVLGLVETGYRGYMSYELCHPLPLIEGKAPEIDFVDKNARLAAAYMKDVIARAKEMRSAERMEASSND